MKWILSYRSHRDLDTKYRLCTQSAPFAHNR
jgi:hypothetical protein